MILHKQCIVVIHPPIYSEPVLGYLASLSMLREQGHFDS